MIQHTITVFIHDTPLRVHEPCTEGQVLTATDAATLNSIALRRFVGRMAVILRKSSELSSVEIAEWAKSTMQAVVAFDSNAGEDFDPVRDEAMALGRELLLARLAAEDLPAPSNLEAHVEELVSTVPELTDQARRRVEIRRQTIAHTLNALEIVP